MLTDVQGAHNPAGRLSDRVAFISGGGTGIGEAAAHLFAREGAKVAVGDIRGDAAEAVAAAIRAYGGEAQAYAMDVTVDQQVKAAIDAAAAHFGKLDLLFNCAGGSLPDDAPVDVVDLAVWDKTMTLDVKGTMLCCRHAVAHLIAAGGGTIVNMSSGAALRGSNRSHVYTAAKGAIVSLTRALAGSYAKHNIRVNAICSGRVNTERVRRSYGIPGQPGRFADPMQIDEQMKTYPFWFGEPQDMANIALFLASHESRMITGASIPADGGRSAY